MSQDQAFDYGGVRHELDAVMRYITKSTQIPLYSGQDPKDDYLHKVFSLPSSKPVKELLFKQEDLTKGLYSSGLVSPSLLSLGIGYAHLQTNASNDYSQIRY